MTIKAKSKSELKRLTALGALDIKRYRALPLPEGGIRAVEAPMGAFCMYSDLQTLLTTTQNQAYEQAAQVCEERGGATRGKRNMMYTAIDPIKTASAIRALKTPTPTVTGGSHGGE